MKEREREREASEGAREGRNEVGKYACFGGGGACSFDGGGGSMGGTNRPEWAQTLGWRRRKIRGRITIRGRVTGIAGKDRRSWRRPIGGARQAVTSRFSSNDKANGGALSFGQRPCFAASTFARAKKQLQHSGERTSCARIRWPVRWLLCFQSRKRKKNARPYKIPHIKIIQPVYNVNYLNVAHHQPLFVFRATACSMLTPPLFHRKSTPGQPNSLVTDD